MVLADSLSADTSKFKTFANDKINAVHVLRFVFERVKMLLKEKKMKTLVTIVFKPLSPLGSLAPPRWISGERVGLVTWCL